MEIVPGGQTEFTDLVELQMQTHSNAKVAKLRTFGIHAVDDPKIIDLGWLRTRMHAARHRPKFHLLAPHFL